MIKYLKICISFLCCVLALGSLCGQTNLEVEGTGFFQNRALKSRLAFLQNLASDERAELDAPLLEDSAFLLLQQLTRDGYLKPSIVAVLQVGETPHTVTWTSPYSIQLEADFVADAVTFEVEAGIIAYYEEVTIEGISMISDQELERYFVPGGVLVQTRKSKIFTRENLDRRIARVVRALDAQGYREAKLIDSQVELNSVTGAARMRLEFAPGARHYVGEVTLTTRRGDVESTKHIDVDSEQILTTDWEQSRRIEFRNQAFEAGYPDAVVTVETNIRPDTMDERIVDVRILADWGQQVRLDGVRFVGDEATRRSLLKRQMSLEPGEPLNRLKASEARRKILGLGIYNQVDLAIEPEEGAERALIYTLGPSVRKELKLLAGWGSYEQLRAGFNWEHKNPFGRAHRYEVDVKQSLKSTHAETTYSIPQIFGTDILLYSNAEYNYREELSYDRTRLGTSVGASLTTGGGLRLAAEYGFYNEEADRDDVSTFESEDRATVASLSFRMSYDQRDDFLAPSSGWSVFSEFEIANELLGGTVNFQRVEVGGSYHLPVSESTLIHLSLRGGAIFTGEDAENHIPFNKRFFSGGENSVRGYQEGAASPLDTGGDEVGAETYALFNFELEQRIYSKFSTVLFFDTVFNARDGFFSSEEDALSSVGLGLRYQTVVGPLRLEYGHNLNPRESDPDGTLHFSIGFPF